MALHISPNVMWHEQTTICKLTQAVPPSATQETSKLLRQFAAIRSWLETMGSSTTQKTDVRGQFTKPLRNSLLRGKSWLNEKHWHFGELLDTSSNLERSVCAHKISETHYEEKLKFGQKHQQAAPQSTVARAPEE